MKWIKTLMIPGLAIGMLGCSLPGSTGHWAGRTFHTASPRSADCSLAAVDHPVAVVQSRHDEAPTGPPRMGGRTVRAAQAGYVSPHASQGSSSNGLTAPPFPALVKLGTSDDLQAIAQNAPGLVLVDFYADWCGPCRRQGGILHEMESTARQNHALIVKVNIDEHQELANQFQISGLPTLVLIKHGEIVGRSTGVADHQKVAHLLSK